MSSKTVEKQLQGLEKRRAEAGERLSELQAKAGSETDVDKLIALQEQLTAAQGEVAACESAIAAGERARLEAQAAERAAAEQHWREKLHPKAVSELDAALGDVLTSLRALRASWDKYLEAKNAWAERWAAEGRFQPGIPNPAGADSLGAYLSVVQARQGGSPSAQAADEEARKLLLGPEVER